MQSNVDKTSKSVYTSPKLVVYGDIRAITQAGMAGAANDGVAAKTL